MDVHLVSPRLHEGRHLLDGVPDVLGLEPSILARDEPSVVDNLSNCAFCSGVIRSSGRVVSRPDSMECFSGSYEFDLMTRRREWTQIQEVSIGGKNAPGFPKSMDHALMRQSSQCLGKEYDVEGVVAERHIHGARLYEVEAMPQLRWTDLER